MFNITFNDFKWISEKHFLLAFRKDNKKKIHIEERMRFMVYSQFGHVNNLKLDSRWKDKPNTVHIMR